MSYNLYLAGPLFSLGERRFNKELADALEKNPAFKVILPQEFAPQHQQKPTSAELFQDCIATLGKIDALICILDGPDVDSGTALEMGYAYASGIPIVGIRTDFRDLVENDADRVQPSGVNLMVAGVCSELIKIKGGVAIDELAVAMTPVLFQLINT